MNTLNEETVREDNDTNSAQFQGNPGDVRKPHPFDVPPGVREGIHRWLRDAAYTPAWLPRPWSHPAIGYFVAVVLPALASVITLFLVIIYPAFALTGTIGILSIVAIAIFWGTGPGLLATVVGAITLNFFVFSPHFSWSSRTDHFVETLFFLLAGIAISLMTSRIEKLRAQATTSHQEAELARSHLQTLFALSTERAGQLEAIFDAITDGVFIVAAHDAVPQMNRAARKLLAIPPGTPDEALPKYPFQLLDEHGKPLSRDQWPQARLLQGKRLQGTGAVDVILKAHNGRIRYLSVTGSPLRDAGGNVTSAVMVCRDVTERRRMEQRNQATLNGLLEMTQLLVQTPAEAFSAAGEQEGRSTYNVAHRLAELTCNMLACERLGIIAIDQETSIMRPLRVIGLAPEQEKEWWAEQEQQHKRFTESPDQSLVARLLSGEVLLIDLTMPPYNTAPNPYGISTMLVAPMKVGDQLVGLITLDYGGADHTYTTDELSIARAAAKFAATIIEREQLLNRQEELRASEIELLSANQQMADLIALAHDAIFVRTPEGVILSWNQGAEQLYGWTAEKAVGQVKYDLLQTRAPLSREALKAALERDGRWEGQLNHVCRDGKLVTVDSRQVLVRDEAGHPTAILEINRDISELEQLTRERAEAYAGELSLRETKERMDEFLGITSHELRTPLTTIKGNIQLAKLRMKYVTRLIQKAGRVPDSDLEEIQTMLDRAERQVNVQGRLIRDLLDISRIQVGKLELNMELCDLSTIVREAVEDQRSAAPRRTITLSLPEPEADISIIADGERISQVVSNYLTNALKYSSLDRPVAAGVERVGDMARVTVRDQGPGLTPAEQQHVWDRFFRVPGVERQKGFSSGLGLGLHICRAIIDEHQGEVGVESAKGVGSTFWFTLPLAETLM